ncbi:MAG: tetratricopeptide repeat protein [Bacteroidia bacterium]|nr:tetratricopeptide repeat protein [Bacteroidia bacterium]
MFDDFDDFFDSEEMSESVQRYEEMLKNKTRQYFDVDEFEQIIDYYLDSNKINNAIQATDLACLQHPDSSIILLKKAQLYINHENPAGALKILKSVEKAESTNYEVYFLKGVVYTMLGNVREAARQFSKALSMIVENKDEVLYDIAIALQETNHYEMALKYLHESYEINKDNPDVIYDIAYCYEKLGKYDKSIDNYRIYLEHDPFSENAWYNLGICYNVVGNFDKAIEAYDFAMAIEPNFTSAHFNKANTLANFGRYKEAIEVYNEFILLEDDNVQAVYYIGECYEKMGEYGLAREYYLKSLDIDESFADAWYGMSVMNLYDGNLDMALYYINRANTLEKNNSDYWFTKGQIYSKMLLPNEAIVCFTKATEIDPADVDSWIELSEMFYAVKEIERAVKLLEDLTGDNSTNADVLYHLAAYHLSMQNKKRGLDYFETALKTDFNSHETLMRIYPGAADDSKVLKMITKYTPES